MKIPKQESTMKRIIVVEDDLIIANDIKNILHELELEIIINIKNYQEAIIAIEEHQPDLVIVDVRLKGDKNGIHIGKYLLQKDQTPYIFISNQTDRLTIDNIKNTRPYWFLAIPFKAIDLIAAVSITLNNYSYKNIDVKRYFSNEEIIDDSPFIIKKIINYIDTNLYEKIEIKKLSSLTTWKEHHFIRVFTRIMGITPYQYILKRKIEKALIIISETNQPINEIAFDLGFSSYNNFYTAFKKYTNNKPEAFRLQSKINANYEFNS